MDYSTLNNNKKVFYFNNVFTTLSPSKIHPLLFHQRTTITYFIPENTKSVKVIFTDAKGNVMKEVEVKETDCVIIETQKMVCNK
jgi:hypothetical protein